MTCSVLPAGAAEEEAMLDGGRGPTEKTFCVGGIWDFWWRPAEGETGRCSKGGRSGFFGRWYRL